MKLFQQDPTRFVGASEIVCLGHIIGSGKLKPDPRKISAMKEFPLPLTKKDMRSFLGVTGVKSSYRMA
jgi:hypothetical protein